jgi:heme A synthase
MSAALKLACALAVLLTGAFAKSTGLAFTWAAARTAGVAGAHVVCGAALLLLLALSGRPAQLALVGVLAASVSGLALDARAIGMLHAMAGILAIALAIQAAGEAAWPHEPCAAHRAAHRRFAYAMAALAGFTLLQVALGAAVRHSGAGLAIPDFPLAMGELFPPLTSPFVAVHFAHRVVGMIVVTLALVCSSIASVDLAAHAAIGRIGRTLAAAVSLQVGLGAYVIWWERAVSVTVAHVANGALALGLTLWLTAIAWRSRPERQDSPRRHG